MDTSTHNVIPRSISVLIRDFDDFIAVDITFNVKFRPNDDDCDLVTSHEHSFMVHLDRNNREESREDNLRALMFAFPNHKLERVYKR